MRVVRRLPSLRRPAPVTTLATVGFEPAQRSPALNRSLPPTPRTPSSMAVAQAAAPVPAEPEAARTTKDELKTHAEALQSASREVLILIDTLKSDRAKLERIQVRSLYIDPIADRTDQRRAARGVDQGLAEDGRRDTRRARRDRSLVERDGGDRLDRRTRRLDPDAARLIADARLARLAAGARDGVRASVQIGASAHRRRCRVPHQPDE